MKKILFTVLILFAMIGVAASEEDTNPYVMGGVAGGGAGDECAGFAICENAEGVGTPSGWADTGSVDWDNTTSPLRETESVVTDTSEAIKSPSVSLGGDFWLFARWSVADGQPSSTNHILRVRDSSDVVIYSLSILTTGEIRHYNGTANQIWGTSLADGASGEYCTWSHVTMGDGANNGETHTWIDLCSNVCSDGTCTRPESESITAVSNGTWDSGDADADHFYEITAGTSNANKLDQILLKASEISSVPD